MGVLLVLGIICFVSWFIYNKDSDIIISPVIGTAKKTPSAYSGDELAK